MAHRGIHLKQLINLVELLLFLKPLLSDLLLTDQLFVFDFGEVDLAHLLLLGQLLQVLADLGQVIQLLSQFL